VVALVVGGLYCSSVLLRIGSENKQMFSGRNRRGYCKTAFALFHLICQLVVFKYLSKDHRPGFRSDKGDISEDEVGIYATVYEPQSMSMPVKHWMESQGSVIFTSTHSGEHQFCFYAAVRDPDSVRFRIEIHVEAGHQAIDYDNVAKVEHLSRTLLILGFVFLIFRKSLKLSFERFMTVSRKFIGKDCINENEKRRSETLLRARILV
jgi:hypothetical protein